MAASASFLKRKRKQCAKQNAVERSEERCRPHTARKNHGGPPVMFRRKRALLRGFYIADAGEEGLRQCFTLARLPPSPAPLPPREQVKERPQNKKEQPVGLHFDFARRLPQSYILKLLDRDYKVNTFYKVGMMVRRCTQPHGLFRRC